MTLKSLPAKHVYQMRQPHQSCRAYLESARRHFYDGAFFVPRQLITCENDPQSVWVTFERN
jgi:hypothetical protein